MTITNKTPNKYKSYLKMTCEEDFDINYCNSFCFGAGCKDKNICKAYIEYNKRADKNKI